MVSDNFPSIGVGKDKIYRVGTCCTCRIPVFRSEPKVLHVCGICDALPEKMGNVKIKDPKKRKEVP